MSRFARHLQRATSHSASSGGFQGQKIAIIGDSLTYQDAGGEESVSEAFEAAGWPSGATWFYGVSGKAINDPDNNGKTTVQVIADARADIDEPDVWVIALGTNDALNFDNPSTIQAHIQQVLTALGANARVAWVNTAGNPDDNFATLNGDVNAAIASAMSARAHSLLVDWSGHILPVSQSSYWVDRVHMTSRGYAIRNQYIATQSITAYSL